MAERVLRRGAVYLIGSYTFPHEIATGGSAKARPVIVLQDELENRNPHYPFVIIAPLTSRKVDAIYPEDVLLPAGVANLPVPSKVLLGLICAIEKTALTRWLGQVDDVHMTQVDAILQRLLGLSTAREQPAKR